MQAAAKDAEDTDEERKQLADRSTCAEDVSRMRIGRDQTLAEHGRMASTARSTAYGSCRGRRLGDDDA